MYRVITVEQRPERMEAVGTKPKFWYDVGTKLFKKCRPGTGEDWAEKHRR